MPNTAAAKKLRKQFSIPLPFGLSISISADQVTLGLPWLSATFRADGLSIDTKNPEKISINGKAYQTALQAPAVANEYVQTIQLKPGAIISKKYPGIIYLGQLENGNHVIVDTNAITVKESHQAARDYARMHKVDGLEDVRWDLLSKETGSVLLLAPKPQDGKYDEANGNMLRARWAEWGIKFTHWRVWLRESGNYYADYLRTDGGYLYYYAKDHEGSACPAAELSGAIFRKIQFENQKAA